MLNYTAMLTFRQFISDYCKSNNLIPNNVPNDTFIDMTEKDCNLSFIKRKDAITFRCNKAKLKFIIVNNYLTCTLI